jgi:hypothetical protein
VDEDGAPFDTGFDDDGPFRGTPEAGGVSLESALRDFGPAAIDDLIPRVRALSSSLDAAHAAGIVHGALHPSRIIINDDETSIVRGIASSAPYLAPEVVAGGASTPRSDQFSLAAITYEWMFGRPISGPARRSVDVRPMPGVNRVALSEAFTRALGREPADRFASCTEFCDALANAEVSELPLLGTDSEEDEDDPIGPFLPEEPSPNIEPVVASIDHETPVSDQVPPPIDEVAPSIDDVKIVAEESIVTAGQPDLDTIDSLNHREEDVPFSTLPDEPTPALASWNPSAAAPSRSMEAPRFGGFALIIAAIVGSVFGFAAGYMARPRALQSGPPETIASAPTNESPAAAPAPAPSAAVAKGAEPAPAVPAPRVPSVATPPNAPSASAATPAPAASNAAANVGRLLVRSTPSGASVAVNGIAKGVTPLALGDLAVGTSDVTIARRGFITETRKVQITRARPSRSLDVRLSAAASATPPRPSTPATIGRPPAPPATAATTTGGLSIDSRPGGAAVTINGKPSGVTPLTINDLPPGEYRILMALPGYHDFATSVRVVAGERARAAASLTAQEKE